MQSPTEISVFLASTFWASASALFAGIYISHSFHITGPFQTTVRFLLKCLHSNLHSHFIHSSLINPLESHDSSYKVVFVNLDLLVLFMLVPVSSLFMCAEVIHKRCTFPLSLRDMRLLPTTPSNFFNTFAPAVTLI